MAIREELPEDWSGSIPEWELVISIVNKQLHTGINMLKLSATAIAIFLVTAFPIGATKEVQEKRSINERVLNGCAHEIVELKKKKTSGTIQGRVKGPDGPFADVLVEVFPSNGKPDEGVYELHSEGRLMSAITDEKGRFSLRVKPGQYRLRFSYSGEWNCTYVRVTAGGFHIWSKNLEIPMSIGN